MGWAELGFDQQLGWVGSRLHFIYCSLKSCEETINPWFANEKLRQIWYTVGPSKHVE